MTTVTDASGPVHTGSGNQFNSTIFVLNHEQRLIRRGPDPRQVAVARLDWLRERFVPPPGADAAMTQLERQRIVLISGPPGAGRQTATTMLLHSFSGGRFQELEADPDGPLLPANLESGDRLLLDLTSSGGADYQAIQARIIGAWPVVVERETRLAVVLPGLEELDDQLWPLVSEISRPDGRDVLGRHLEADEIEFAEAELDVPELARKLREAPMRELAELVRRVRMERDRGGGGFTTWRAKALESLTGQAEAVAVKVAGLAAGADRALLLTAAMLDDAPLDAVFAASAALLRIVRHPADETPQLERADLRERLRRCGAEVTPERQVRFATLGEDLAVRTHFWDYYPGLRANFGEWVAGALALPALADRERDGLVTRFTEQCLRVGRPRDVVALVESCVGRGSALLPQAALALEQGLDHDRHGGVFRRQLYAWSRENPPRPGLGQVLIQMCTGVLAATHPDQALVRLHHLGRRDRGDRLGAAPALRALVGGDDRLLRLLLSRFADNLDERASTQRADLLLFPRVIDPRWLIRPAPSGRTTLSHFGVREYLLECWRAALTHRSSADLGPDLRDWLDAGIEHEDAAVLLDVLADAAAGRFRPMAVLTAIARQWARDGAGDRDTRERVAKELTAYLHSTQGFGENQP